jgi:hypothetical protein
MKKHAAAPIIAAIFLLLPVLYVGSYLALVVPDGVDYKHYLDKRSLYYATARYRYQGRLCANIFWPLEQIDRKVRPGAWAMGDLILEEPIVVVDHRTSP